MFRTVLFVATGVALLVAAVGPRAQTTSRLEPAFPSLSFTTPIELTHAGDGSGLVYVAEKTGRVRSFVNAPTTATTTTVLDISALVLNSGEQGFLGMAFHPNFATNGYLYVHYSGRTNGRTVLARYTRSATNPAVFDPASAQILLEVAQPYSNHNGGKLAFGPDGYLYLSLGDGGSANDPGNRSQDRDGPPGQDAPVRRGQPRRRARLRHPAEQPLRGQHAGLPAGDLRLRPPQHVQVLLRPRHGHALGGRRGQDGLRGDRLGPLGRQLRLARRRGPATATRPSPPRATARPSSTRSTSTRTPAETAPSPADRSTAARATRTSRASTSSATTARAACGR